LIPLGDPGKILSPLDLQGKILERKHLRVESPFAIRFSPEKAAVLGPWLVAGSWRLVALSGEVRTANSEWRTAAFPANSGFYRHHPLPRLLLRVYEIKQPIAVSADTLMCDEWKSEVVLVQQLRNLSVDKIVRTVIRHVRANSAIGFWL
jgi:hypothetical protein